MKPILILLASTTFLFASCCKVQLAIGIHVSYPNLTHDADFKLLVVDKADPSAVFQTVDMGQLNALNNYAVFVDLDFYEPYNFIIQADSLNYSDTITDFTYEIKGRNCNTRVENLSYRLNGVLHTEFQLEIP